MLHPDLLNTGELLRRYRHAVGLTQEELAERAALSARSISDIERGISLAPHRGTLDALADGLNLSSEERDLLLASARIGRIWGGADVPVPSPSDAVSSAGHAPTRPFAYRAMRKPAAAVSLARRTPVRLVLAMVVIVLAAALAFKITQGSNSPSTLSAAQAFSPWQIVRVEPVTMGFSAGLASDARGNIYAGTVSANPRANGVWKIAPSGEVLDHWGSRGRSIIYGNDIALDRKGNIFVVDSPHARVLRLSPAGRVTAVWGSNGSMPGKFVQPDAIAVDRHDHVFVGDATGSIQQFTETGKLLTDWPDCGDRQGGYCHPSDMAIDARGNVYVSDYASASVRKLSPSGRPLADWGTPGSDPTQFYAPAEIGFDARGHVFVADQGNGRLHQFTSDGKPLSWWGVTSPGLFCPISLAIDAEGNFYVGDCKQATINKFSVGGIPLTGWKPFRKVPLSFGAPSGLAIDQAGHVFVLTSDAAHAVFEISPADRVEHAWSQDVLGAGQAHAPVGAAVDRAGNVYVVDSAANRVVKLSSEGHILATFGTEGSGPGQLENPSAVAVDQNGNLYVSDTGNRRVVTFSPTGNPSGAWTTAPDGTALFLQPEGITLDARGNVFVADRAKHAIEKLSADGILKAQWGGGDSTLMSAPVGIAADHSGTVYVTDVGDSTVKAFSPGGRLIGRWGKDGTGPGEFDQPIAVSVDRNGTVYVADAGNKRIQRLAVR